jgi:hypothetical protein
MRYGLEVCPALLQVAPLSVEYSTSKTGLPFDAPSVNVATMLSSSPTALDSTGAPGTVPAVADKVFEAIEVPTRFLLRIWIGYVVPETRSEPVDVVVITKLVAELHVPQLEFRHVAPPSVEYSMLVIVAPESVPKLNDNVIEPLPATAPVSAGAPGPPRKYTGYAALAGLVPSALVTRSLT